jgi:DNA-binding CsgD family transcriptional regulator/tetratricopeptide (TPR) repeat protein
MARPAHRSYTRPAMPRTGPVQCPILVGRDEVLQLFDQLIDGAAHGRGHALFLSGQAGLGKTRLIRAAIRKAEGAGLRVDGGSVVPQDHQVPLASIREMATGMRGNSAFGTLSEDLLAIDGRHAGDALGARRIMVRSAADRILEAIDRPTMLIFDDLHWADEMSLEVIGELARHAEGRPLLLVGGYRADEFPADTIHREWRARLLSQRQADEVRLRRLTLDETAIATTLILGGELPAPRDVVEAVHERTNGIPLHIEELLAALDDRTLADGRQIRQAHVPDTIGDAVLARLSRLSEDAQLVARAGAVIGRCFSPDVLAGIMDRPLTQLEPTIEELVNASILYPFDYIDQGYYDFRHQLLRDAIYGAVPPSQLRRFHGHAAEFVMTLEGSNVVHASRHYERAGLRPQAFRASLTAAREASRISARQEAYELYQRAIDNMPADLPIGEQAELFARYADAAAAIEQNEDCVAAATRARDLYLEAGQPIDAAGMLTAMSIKAGRGAAPTGEVAAYTVQALDEIAGLPETLEREKLRAQLLSLRANDLFLASELEAARAHANQAHELAAAVADRETVLEVDLLLARIDILDGRYETGLSDGLRAAREARDAGFESVGVTGYRNIALLAARIMDWRAAENALAEGLQYADAIEQSHCRQVISTTTALLDWGAGHWDAADERARQDLVDRGCRRGVVGSLDVIGLVAMGRGRPDEARRWLGESLEVGRHVGEPQLILPPLWGLAETDLLAGDPAAAIARCEEGWAIASSSGERALFVPFVVTGTRALIAARRPDDAERWFVRAREHLAGWQSVAGPALNHADGLVHLAKGSLSAARESLERAVRGWEERARTWEALAARLDLVQCLLRMNRHADAAGIVSDVRARAKQLESEPLLLRADELARLSRGRGHEAEPWRPLTVREFEIARLIATGMTNAEIAAQLVLSPKTVSAHVEHILAKLGVARRTEIAAWAAGIAPGEQPTVPASQLPVPATH